MTDEDVKEQMLMLKYNLRTFNKNVQQAFTKFKEKNDKINSI